jgi:parallel beta-helix repeat protein
MVDRVNGFTPSGTFKSYYTHLVGSYVVGVTTYYYSANAFQIVYGGEDDAGTVDGTDAAAVIQAALDDGGLTYLKNGAYPLLRKLTLISGNLLVGESQSGVVLTGFNTAVVYALIDGSDGVDNCVLANFTFDVNNNNAAGTQLPNVGLGIVIVGSNNRAENLTIYNSYLQGIVMGLDSHALSENNLIVNCTVYNSGNDGLVFCNSRRSHMYNCTVHDTYGVLAGGFNLAYGCYDCSIEDSHSDTTAYGFATDHSLGAVSSNLTFRNCESDNTLVNGFIFDGGDAINCIDCTARNFEDYGFTTYTHPVTSTFPTNSGFINCSAIGDGTVHSATTPVGFLLGGGANVTVTGGMAKDNVLGAEVTAMEGAASIIGVSFENSSEHHLMGAANAHKIVECSNMYDVTSDVYFDATTAPYVRRSNSATEGGADSSLSNVTASKVLDTWYQNTNGKATIVYFSFSKASATGVYVYVSDDGATEDSTTTIITHQTADIWVSDTIIVPPGWYIKIKAIAAAPDNFTWFEMLLP